MVSIHGVIDSQVFFIDGVMFKQEIWLNSRMGMVRFPLTEFFLEKSLSCWELSWFFWHFRFVVDTVCYEFGCTVGLVCLKVLLNDSFSCLTLFWQCYTRLELFAQPYILSLKKNRFLLQFPFWSLLWQSSNYCIQNSQVDDVLSMVIFQNIMLYFWNRIVRNLGLIYFWCHWN